MKQHKDISDATVRAMRVVWEQIAADVDADMTMDNETAVELVCDADRLTTFGYPDADAEMQRILKEHGWTAGWEILNRVQLV